MLCTSRCMRHAAIRVHFRRHQALGRRMRCDAAAAPARVAVVGGGLAGLACAVQLSHAGIEVTLVEQGRGLGGRVCTRRGRLADGSGDVSFDHGAQYVSAKAPGPFQQLIAQGAAEGWLARWPAAGGGVGEIACAAGGQLDASTWAPYPPSKELWVGVPRNSEVGKRLAAACGPRLVPLTATRAEALRPAASGSGGRWRLQLRSKEAGQRAAVDQAAATVFDGIVTAMSANSTAKLLAGVAPAAAAAAAAVDSNVCWALLVCLAKPTGLPFSGALVSGSPSLAWLARDDSKPGRALPPGAAEAWVVHATPAWSHVRRDLPCEQAAQQLLAEFLAAAGLEAGAPGLLYVEAHRWTNAFPLNPRPPQRWAGAPGAQGRFVAMPDQRLVACGDWCAGPRAADAYASGLEAAQAMLCMLE